MEIIKISNYIINKYKSMNEYLSYSNLNIILYKILKESIKIYGEPIFEDEVLTGKISYPSFKAIKDNYPFGVLR